MNYAAKPDDAELYSTQPETAELHLHVPAIFKSESANAQNDHDFTFHHLFPLSVTQEQVFRAVAVPRVDDVLDGYNATVFAYGQTGSGKTHTMTGGATSYEQRGIIPRSLEYLFTRVEDDTSGDEIAVSVSYMQVYMNGAYDLLSADATTRDVDLSSLTRVRFLEDRDRTLHLRGLGVRPATTAAAALETLFVGDCNRVVASTLQNNVSSRSHAVFTVYITRKRVGASTTTRAKLNFVDLAGSERVSRTLADGTVLQEAQYINSSLFHLERVIHALNTAAPHVPYRSSLITLVLRDSLGGNCKASMVACAAVEPDNIADSVSTCRFAMRVAEIKNRASVNESLDLNVLVSRLRAENRLLRAELAALKGVAEADAAQLSEADRAACRALVAPFACGESDGVALDTPGEYMQECFRQLRDIMSTSQGRSAETAETAEAEPAEAEPADASPSVASAELDALRALLEQRDAEIEILTEALDRLENGDADLRPCTADLDSEAAVDLDCYLEPEPPLTDECPAQTPSPPLTHAERLAAARACAGALCPVDVDDIPDEVRVDAAALFDLFSANAPRAQEAASDAAVLAELIADATAGADAMREAKRNIETLRAQAEHIERRVAAAGPDAAGELEPLAADTARELAERRAELGAAMNGMKALKTKIESMQVAVRRAQQGVRSAFEEWVSALADILDLEESAEDI